MSDTKANNAGGAVNEKQAEPLAGNAATTEGAHAGLASSMLPRARHHSYSNADRRRERNAIRIWTELMSAREISEDAEAKAA